MRIGRALPWVCPSCRNKSISRIELFDSSLRAVCSECGEALYLGSPEANWEIIVKEGDYIIAKHIEGK